MGKGRKTSAHRKDHCHRQNLAALVAKSKQTWFSPASTSIRKCLLLAPHKAIPRSGICSPLQAFAMQTLGCTRHNTSKLVFCSHLHMFSLVLWSQRRLRSRLRRLRNRTRLLRRCARTNFALTIKKDISFMCVKLMSFFAR